jgi:hypothetical protein
MEEFINDLMCMPKEEFMHLLFLVAIVLFAFSMIIKH